MKFIKNTKYRLFVVKLVLILPFGGFPQTINKQQFALNKTKIIINEIIAKSFPELEAKNIKVKTFQSQDTFFKAQFSIDGFLTFQKIKTTIFVNPKVFELNAPEEGIRAILAHELAHAVYYKNKNRLQLIGLISLISRKFTVKFERRADLAAIEKGYGEGLIKYREWLYQHISDEQILVKERNYFTPQELKVLLPEFNKNPEIINWLNQNVPRNLDELIICLRKQPRVV
jgi:hypothetical protein